MAQVKVDFGGHIRIPVDASVLWSWFPLLQRAPAPFWVDGSELVDDLQACLPSHYNINRTTIRATLMSFFEKLSSTFAIIPGETRMRIAAALGRALQEDIYISAADTLRRSRRCFVILAYLANVLDSLFLAGALREFWFEWGGLVNGYDPIYYQEWRNARNQLPEGLPDDGRVRIPAIGMPRGRSISKWPGVRSRGVSLPPARRLSPDMPGAVVTLPRGYYPTSPMPVGFPTANYFDDIGQLQWQQQMVNNKLDNMDQKLDVMIWGQRLLH